VPPHNFGFFYKKDGINKEGGRIRKVVVVGIRRMVVG
jgi:hypothetical protein